MMGQMVCQSPAQTYFYQKEIVGTIYKSHDKPYADHIVIWSNDFLSEEHHETTPFLDG